MKWLVADFETASACELKKAGAWRYAEDLTTEILCLAYARDGANRPSVWMPGEPTDELLALARDPDLWWIAHNASFEKAIWRKIMMPDFGMPDIPNSRWHDTMAAAAHKALPQELEKLLQVLGVSHQKDMEGRKITLAMSKPNKGGYYDRSAEKRARSATYCAEDIYGETEAHRIVGWLPPKERNVWLLNQRVNERGIRLDMDFVANAQKIVDDASRPLLREFQLLTGLQPTQAVKLREWCRDEGTAVPDLKKETITALIGGEDEDDPDYESLAGDDDSVSAPISDRVRRALRIRQLVGSASVKKLKRMALCVSHDGRARGLSQYHGTAPGRAAGRLLQPYNFPRGTLKIGTIDKDGKAKEVAPDPKLVVDAIMTGDHEYVETAIGTGAVEVVVSALRHALIPEDDRIFISGDYAGIQARVVLALAGQYDKTEIFSDDRLGKKGEDVYCDMAGRIYNRLITKADMAERQVGKNSVLGLGFQMGWRKFLLKYAKEHPAEFAQLVVETYRKKWAPKVPYLWYGLSDAAIKCVWSGNATEHEGIEYRMEGNAMSCRLPSGRKIWYQHPEKTRDPMPWDHEDIRNGFQYHVMKMGQWKTVHSFGGLLTENVVMGIEVDIQRHAMFKCEKEGFPVVLEVYDEVVVEPKKENADVKAFKQILLDVEPWVDALKIPIAVDTWSGDRYRK